MRESDPTYAVPGANPVLEAELTAWWAGMVVEPASERTEGLGEALEALGYAE